MTRLRTRDFVAASLDIGENDELELNWITMLRQKLEPRKGEVIKVSPYTTPATLYRVRIPTKYILAQRC